MIIRTYCIDDIKIQEETIEKLNNEYEEFKEILSKMSPKDILKNSRKILFYEDLQNLIKICDYKEIYDNLGGKNLEEIYEYFEDYYEDTNFLKEALF